ncbi:double-strand break repair protein AddB like protein [Wolbachia endosymbiont of Armadillidium vulgare str. wVulC]|uniref:ATP-dependent helicase/nuclease subunit B n=1 Tax=Wolbachia pipientis TaxID=955 RepID=A0A097GWG2_WOLPI|nr:PD-(D/E)XK nuclease family protein [Wolbachia endosymbiont of Armadillidium vulgare]AIT39430.1 ATP-dependent helicase/nuclease subunit B [Wolbachia pipientis]KLT22862.1 double-strand break repair protein AddB like protein [Wolbachia endosymbiont of Armadillidium vulgare str. wVulC]OJH31663.1 ATP-dependent helicase/deoxyribonuclease subunit B [Wolbachia endosymbiont of Armadillidium vulgare]OJH32072.1 ATP-dependent helicase/deoxyribonuclease subunit B [Wolbachia endosymbiont of Armadillidium 
MGKVFTINVDASFFDVLVQHIFSGYERKEIPEIKIILPCKRDVIALLSAFKSCSAIILPEIVSLENIDEEDLILNLDRVKVINPTKRMLLLIQFILKWNKKNNDNFPIDLACSLPSLLQYTQIADYYQLDEHSKKMENFINLLIETWSKILKDLGVVDILEHKSDYINNMIISLQEDQHIIFVGIGKDKSLIKAIYDLPFGKIILPNLNLKIKEKDWKLLDKKHYQYCLRDLLDYLNVDRRDVSCLNTIENEITDYVFDTTADLSKVSNGHIGNIEVITCDSREEEAQVTSLIIENEGYENVSLFVFDKLLAARMACTISKNYSCITLLFYSIEVLTSNWNSVALLSLLKHSLVTFGYTQEEYTCILSEFEIEVLRSFSTNGLSDIINAINAHRKLKYKEDILIIINSLKAILNSLLNLINHPISDIVAAHLQCINVLSNVNFSELNGEIGNFTRDFLNACEGIAIDCSLELYSKILILFLKRKFFSPENNCDKFSLYHNKVVILAGFNDIPNFQNPFLNALTREKFNLPSVQEEQGYFLYTLRNLFGAGKVYITRLMSDRKSILLRRLEVLLQEPKYPYRDWLRILNTPECIVPCTQPMPKPQTEVRQAKMQVMSCSAIEKLIRNPYSFYVEYILGLKQLRDLNFKPSILEFGTMVHNILARYLRDRKFPMSVAREVFSSSQFHFSNIWWVRLQRVIQSFVEFDEVRNNHVELEKEFSYPIFHDQCQATRVTEEISLTARCDRLEYLPSGQVAIIDYKLGSPPSNEEVMSGFFPQLILQALAVEYTTKKEVSELAYWKLDYDKIKVIALKDYRQKMHEFQNILPNFLSNYLRDTTPFIASPYFNKFLRFNSYKQLERIEEWL